MWGGLGGAGAKLQNAVAFTTPEDEFVRGVQGLLVAGSNAVTVSVRSSEAKREFCNQLCRSTRAAPLTSRWFIFLLRVTSVSVQRNNSPTTLHHPGEETTSKLLGLAGGIDHHDKETRATQHQVCTFIPVV